MATQTKTWNWGNAIVLTFILFAGFIGTMVYRMTAQKVDLVAEDYYQREEAYQQQIEKIKNTSRFNPKNIMTYSATEHTVRIALPTYIKKGEVTFFRPSDKNLDFTIPVAAQSNSLLKIPTDKLPKGLWRVQATWTDGRDEYYLEDEIMIN